MSQYVKLGELQSLESLKRTHAVGMSQAHLQFYRKGDSALIIYIQYDNDNFVIMN